jgi:hypothetical protein
LVSSGSGSLGKTAPASINQALAAVTLRCAQAGLRLTVKRAQLALSLSVGGRRGPSGPVHP